jgi:predicted kinase
MLGYPGAGKTTTAHVIHELTGAVHLWADRERRDLYGTPTYSHEENLQLYAQMNDEAAHLLRRGQSVIYDTNFKYSRDREHLRGIAKRVGAETVLVWVVVPKEVAEKRATDGAELQDTRVLGDMPLETFNHLADNLERPSANEHVVQLDGTKITPEYVRRELGL